MAHSRDQELYFSIQESQLQLSQYILGHKNQITSVKANDDNYPFSWQHFIVCSLLLKQVQEKISALLLAFNEQGELKNVEQFDAINQKLQLLNRLREMHSHFIEMITQFYPNGTKKADFNPKQFISHLSFIYQLQGMAFTEDDQFKIREKLFEYCRFIGEKIEKFACVDDINEEELSELEKEIKALKIFSAKNSQAPYHPECDFVRDLIQANYSETDYSVWLLKELGDRRLLGHVFSRIDKKFELNFSTLETFRDQFSAMHQFIAPVMKQYTENMLLLKTEIENFLRYSIYFTLNTQTTESQFKIFYFERTIPVSEYVTYYLICLLPGLLSQALHLNEQAFADLIKQDQFGQTKRCVDQLAEKIKSILNVLQLDKANVLPEWESYVKNYSLLLKNYIFSFFVFFMREKDIKKQSEFLEMTATLDEFIKVGQSVKKEDDSKKENVVQENIEMKVTTKLPFVLEVLQLFLDVQVAHNVIYKAKAVYLKSDNPLSERKIAVDETLNNFREILRECEAHIRDYSRNIPFLDNIQEKEAAKTTLLNNLYQERDKAKNLFEAHEQWLTRINKESKLSGSRQYYSFWHVKREALSQQSNGLFPERRRFI